MSKSLVTASPPYSEVTSLYRDDPPIAWYLAIGSAAITGKPCYIGTDGPRPLPPAAQYGFTIGTDDPRPLLPAAECGFIGTTALGPFHQRPNVTSAPQPRTIHHAMCCKGTVPDSRLHAAGSPWPFVPRCVWSPPPRTMWRS